MYANKRRQQSLYYNIVCVQSTHVNVLYLYVNNIIYTYFVLIIRVRHLRGIIYYDGAGSAEREKRTFIV